MNNTTIPSRGRGRPPKQPRDLDNFLWRGPAALKRRVEASAQNVHLSQNAFVTTSLLFSTIVFGDVAPKGPPKNLRFLIRLMNEARDGDDTVLSAMHRTDWDEVKGFVDLLVEGEVVSDLRVRQDARGQDTVAFTFRFTKEGAEMWDGFWKLISSIKNIDLGAIPKMKVS